MAYMEDFAAPVMTKLHVCNPHRTYKAHGFKSGKQDCTPLFLPLMFDPWS